MLVLVLFSWSVFADSTHPSSEHTFVLQKVVVIGDSPLKAKDIDPLVTPHRGKEATGATIEEIANAITQLLEKKGNYSAIAFVPPQDFKDGIAYVLIYDGHLEQISIVGNKVYSSDFIRYYIAPAIHDGILDRKILDKQVLLLNEFSDLQVRSSLTPGKKLGGLDLILEVQDKHPVHGSVDYNNYGNSFTGRNEASLQLSDGDVMGKGDAFGVRALFLYPSLEHPVLQGSYTIPISSSASKFSVSYSNSDLKVGGEEFLPLELRGTANIYSLGYSTPLVRTLREASDFNLSLSLQDNRNFVFDSILTNQDKTRYLTLSYDFRETTERTRDILNASVTRGLGTIFNGLAADDPNASHLGADDSFTKVNVDMAQIRKAFSNDFLFFHATGQWALAPLVVSHQFALGGPDSVRGFSQSEFLGDTGWTMTGEFRFPITKPAATSMQGVFFVDTGGAYVRNPLPGQISSQDFTGTGVGVRANLQEWGSIRADLGFPLHPNINLIGARSVFYLQSTFQFR